MLTAQEQFPSQAEHSQHEEIPADSSTAFFAAKLQLKWSSTGKCAVEMASVPGKPN